MTSEVTVRFETAEGEARSARVAVGATLLDAARAAHVDMEATCGARGRCRSCRVKVLAGEIPPATVQDTLQLGFDEVHERFRLACQTRLIDDCTVRAMPPKTESGHQILAGDVDVSDARLTLDSGVVKQLIKAKAPVSEHHQTSDSAEILACLPKQRRRRSRSTCCAGSRESCASSAAH
jgi:ferredoxin